MKVGRNDPCPCGSGQKYKKCCIDKEVEVAPSPQMTPDQEARKALDEQLTRYAPKVTVTEVENKIREAFKSGSETPIQVVEKVFSDDNLNLKNKKQADRLFRAFMGLWNVIAEQEKSQAQQ